MANDITDRVDNEIGKLSNLARDLDRLSDENYERIDREVMNALDKDRNRESRIVAVVGALGLSCVVLGALKMIGILKIGWAIVFAPLLVPYAILGICLAVAALSEIIEQMITGD